MEAQGLFRGSSRRIYSPEQWDDLRPTIRELYLGSNWSFKKIATYLRDQSNFQPTENQFKKKMKEWNFRKNRTGVERERARLRRRLEPNRQITSISHVEDKESSPPIRKEIAEEATNLVNCKECSMPIDLDQHEVDASINVVDSMCHCIPPSNDSNVKDTRTDFSGRDLVQLHNILMYASSSDVQNSMRKRDISISTDETTPREYLPLLKHPCPTEPLEDLHMTHHVAQIITELEKNGGHLMSLGTSSLPAFLRLAQRFEFVKHGLLGLGTAHLNSLVKLPYLGRLAIRYCQSACLGIQDALEQFTPDNSDAVLATSILLGWQTKDTATYAKFAQGISHVLTLMRSWNDESQLPELLGPTPPLSGRMKDALRSYSTIPEHSLSSLTPLSDALTKLESELEEGTELNNAAQTFSCYVQNLRDLPNEVTLEEQLSLLFRVRTFLPMIPSRFLGIGTRDIWVLVVMAYYHVVQVATAIKFPTTATLIFAIKRTEIILRIDNELRSINKITLDVGKARDLEQAISMMRLPVLYVVDYRFRCCVLKE